MTTHTKTNRRRFRFNLPFLLLAALIVSVISLSRVLAEQPTIIGDLKRVVVQFRNLDSAVTDSDTAVKQQRQLIAKMQNSVAGQTEGAIGHVRQIMQYQNLPMAVYEVDDVGEKTLRANPNITSVSLDKLVEPLAVLTSPITTVGGTPNNGFSDSLTQTSYNGSGYSVAVLDTGVDKTNPMLADKVIYESCYGLNLTNAIYGNYESFCGNTSTEDIDISTAAGSAMDCDFTTIAGCGHGTGVAGIVTMAKSNPTDSSLAGDTITLRGVAADSKIIAMKVFIKGSGMVACGQANYPCVRVFDSLYIQAIDDLLGLTASQLDNTKIAAVNMSLGGGAYESTTDCQATSGYQPVKAAFEALRAKGIAVIVANGNDGQGANATTASVNANKIASPACVEGATSVAAASIDGSAVASYSQNGTLTDLIAPGGDLSLSNVLVTDYNLCLAWYGWESLLNSGITPDNINTNPCLKPNLNTVYISTQAGGGIQYMQGTSMATPVVAGAFSALRQKHPNASVDQLLGILQTTGTPLNDNRLGYTFDDAGTSAQKRLINLGAALSANQAPIISNFTGPTERVNQNATVNLLADVANATSCSLNNNIGNVAITSGKINVDVPAKASYELTCANELNDTDSATLTLNINTAPSVPGSPDITNIDKSTGSFTIRWKASTDSDGVSSYRVSLDGKLIKTVNGDVLEYRFSDVDLSKEHTVTIEAVDSLGAISEAASFEVPAAKEDALIAADEKFEEQGGVAAAIASGLKSPNGGFSNILPSPIMVLGCGVLLAFGVTISRYKLSRR